MTGWQPWLAQRSVRRVLSLFGVLGVCGAAATTAGAVPLPERAALEARVAELRRHLNSPATGDAATPAALPPTLIAQAGRWNNWPNWSNWANWSNG